MDIKDFQQSFKIIGTYKNIHGACQVAMFSWMELMFNKK